MSHRHPSRSFGQPSRRAINARGLTPGQEAARLSRPSTIPGQAQPPTRRTALTRALPAPSVWIADLVILGLALALLRLLW